MASLFTHVAFPLALRSVDKASKKVFWWSMFCACLPDADVLAFSFGIPYASDFGHRGFTHSMAFGLFMGGASTFFFPAEKRRAFCWSFLSTVSHPLMDAFTNGGLGVAFLWPFSSERFFFPYHPVQVSPIGVGNFFTKRGFSVLFSEFLWIWTPFACLMILVRMVRQRKTSPC